MHHSHVPELHPLPRQDVIQPHNQVHDRPMPAKNILADDNIRPFAMPLHLRRQEGQVENSCAAPSLKEKIHSVWFSSFRGSHERDDIDTTPIEMLLADLPTAAELTKVFSDESETAMIDEADDSFKRHFPATSHGTSQGSDEAKKDVHGDYDFSPSSSLSSVPTLFAHGIFARSN